MTHEQLEMENRTLREVVRTLITDLGEVVSPRGIQRADTLMSELDHDIDRHRRDDVVNSLSGNPPLAQELDRLHLARPVKYTDYLKQVDLEDRLNIHRARSLVSDLFRPVRFDQELGGDNPVPTELWSVIQESHHTDSGHDPRGNLSIQQPTFPETGAERVSVFLHYSDGDHVVRIRLFDRNNRLPECARIEDIEITTTLADGQIVDHHTAEVLSYNLFEAALYHAFADIGITLNPPTYPDISFSEAVNTYLKYNPNTSSLLIINHRQHPHLDYTSTYLLSYDPNDDPEWQWKVSVLGQISNVSQHFVQISDRRFAELPLLHRRALLDGLLSGN